MDRKVDVAIMGAGSAGLFAAREVAKVTQDYVLIDPGPYGSTCARTACMPSKVLIQIANDYHRRSAFDQQGILGADRLKIDTRMALQRVRTMRDHFVSSVMKSIETHREHLIPERARFLSPNLLQVGKSQIQAEKVIIATGSRPVLSPEFSEMGELVLTSETIFELEDLPQRIAVIGVGVIGAELGQALSRLGVQVTGFHLGSKLSGMTDPVVQEQALQILSSEFPIHMGTRARLVKRNGSLIVDSEKGQLEVDAVLASTGRRPNVDNIGLENTGAQLDARGNPIYDPSTMQLKGLPIFIAGDADGDRPVLPETSDEGRIAGYNAVRGPHCFKRRTGLAIAFTSPNVSIIGSSFRDLQGNVFAVGEVSFEDQGRAKIEQKNKGVLRVYGDKKTGKLIGAEMMAPGGEHLAHILALAIHKGLTVFDLLSMPFYHPVVEQGLRTALRDLAQHMEKKVHGFEAEFCAELH